MLDTTFYARGDSSTSNNNELNVRNLSQQDVLELTFVNEDINGDSGDFLFPTEGTLDTNTTVFVNGTGPYEFIFEEVGTMPIDSKVPTELEGEIVYVITILNYPVDGESTRVFFFPEADPDPGLIATVGNGAIDIGDTTARPPVCFLSGTKIDTPNSPVSVDDLHVGDLVMTKDADAQPITWISSSLAVWPGSDDDHKPVCIKMGALGEEQPSQELMVSPQHHILFKSDLCLELFGTQEVLAPAKGLTGLPGVRVMAGKKAAEYYHVMTAQHEILIAHGVETESFYPGPTAVRMLNTGQRASFFAVVPALRDDPENGYGPTARQRITRRQAEELVAAMKAAKTSRAAATA